MSATGFRVFHISTVIAALIFVTPSVLADETDLGEFVGEAESSVFAFVALEDVAVVLVGHNKSLLSNGVVLGDVYAAVLGADDIVLACRRGYLAADWAAGFADEAGFAFQWRNSETSYPEIVYFNAADKSFRGYAIRPIRVGDMAIWNNAIFYSTEHFDNNIHFVDLDSGEVHEIPGSGETFSNADFWIIDDNLYVTEWSDTGPVYRLDRTGLSPASEVTVTPETKVGFNLRDIRDVPNLQHYEELLGIR